MTPRHLMLMLITLAAVLGSHDVPAQDPPAASPAAGPLETLRATRMTLVRDRIPVMELLTTMAQRAGVPVVVSSELGDELSDGDYAVALAATDVAIGELLEAVLHMVSAVAVERDGAVLLCFDYEQGESDRVSRVYDVSDLIRPARDEYGVRLGPQPPSFAEPGDDQEQPEPLDVDVLDDQISRLFDEVAFEWTCRHVGHTLLVVAPEAGHRMVAGMLERLRAQLVSLRIDTSTWQITADAWREVAGGHGGLLDDAALQRLAALPAERARCVDRQRATGANWQRVRAGFTSAVQWRNSVRSVATSGQSAPPVATHSDQTTYVGRSLAVRSISSVDSDRILVDVVDDAASVANIDPATPAGTPQLPRFRSQLTSTRLAIPDGGTMVLAGELWPGATLPSLPAATDDNAPTLVLISAHRTIAGRSSPDPVADRRNKLLAMADRLAATRVNVHVESTPVEAVLRTMLGGTGMSSLVSSRLMECDAQDRAVSLDADGASVISLLRQMSAALDYTFSLYPGNLIAVGEDDELRPAMCEDTLDVNDLIAPPRTSTGRSAPPALLDPEESSEFPDDLDEEDPVMLDDLQNQLEESVEPDGWGGGSVSDAPLGRLRLVHGDPTVLLRARRLIDAQRATINCNVCVEWEVRTITDAPVMRALEDADAVDDALYQRVVAGSSLQRSGLLGLPAGQFGFTCSGTWHAEAITASGSSTSSQSADGAQTLWQQTHVRFGHEGMIMELRPVPLPGGQSIQLGIRMSLGEQRDASSELLQHEVRGTITLAPGSRVVAAFLPASGAGHGRVLLLRASTM
ncbi:MAG: hypothetical protein AB7K09_20445 [Planctomycetota bacterium]